MFYRQQDRIYFLSPFLSIMQVAVSQNIAQTKHNLITSAEEGGYVFGAVCLSVCLFVCLSVRRITRKLVNGF